MGNEYCKMRPDETDPKIFMVHTCMNYIRQCKFPRKALLDTVNSRITL